MEPADLPEISLDLESRIITRSVRIRPGRHDLPDVWRKGAVVIEADDVVVDFQGAVLSPGGEVRDRLDQLEGYGIVIRDRRNVTLRNAVVRGFRFNVFVLGGDNICIENCDLSFSRGHRIGSAGVPIDQWVVIRNLRDWRSYGAGLWLEDTVHAVVRGCRAGGAQNGIVLARCRHSLVTENDLAFNSGWGIALWESCDNVVSWNLADFCNRPWAAALGADACGLALAGGSHRNLIVGNSLTHGGDGFFLTDSSDGGYDPSRDRYLIAGASDENIIAGNDGSWSPANAFEGTFSRGNVYYRNLATDCGFGFWLGFSSDSLVLDNDIRANLHAGIAIEQGQGTRIVGNRLAGNRGPAIRLWAVPGPARDRFPSRDLEIRGNRIEDSPQAVDLAGSSAACLADNTLRNAPLPPALPDAQPPDPVSALTRFEQSPACQRVREILAARPPGFRFYRETPGPFGCDWYDPGPFAPRDLRTALGACRGLDAGTLELFLFDPEHTEVHAPPWTTLTRDPAGPHRVRITLPAVTDGPGATRLCRLTLRHGERQEHITRQLASNLWHLRWFDWAPAGRPLAWDDADAWRTLLAGPPLAESTARDLGPGWFAGQPAPGVPRHHFALHARTQVLLPEGPCRLAVAFDDALRLLLDGREVYANWRRNRPQLADLSVPVAAGPHQLEVQFCTEDRYAVLRWYWPETP